MKIIWADKVAFIAASVLLLLLAVFWWLAFIAIGGLGAGHLWASVGWQSVGLDLAIAGSIWLFVQLINVLFDGSARAFLVSGVRRMRLALMGPRTNVAPAVGPFGDAPFHKTA